MKFTFTDHRTGETWPLEDADVDYNVLIYKSDRRKATIGDPRECLIATSIRDHNKDVLCCHIGSGNVATIVFKGKGRREPYALNYLLPAKARKIRDLFEVRGSPATQLITLAAPTAGMTMEARRARDRQRTDNKGKAVREAATKHVEFDAVVGGPKKPRKKPTSRLERIGVPPRPKPIVKNGNWSLPIEDELEDVE